MLFVELQICYNKEHYLQIIDEIYTTYRAFLVNDLRTNMGLLYQIIYNSHHCTIDKIAFAD